VPNTRVNSMRVHCTDSCSGSASQHPGIRSASHSEKENPPVLGGFLKPGLQVYFRPASPVVGGVNELVLLVPATSAISVGSAAWFA
jgi:hypothetical protein